MYSRDDKNRLVRDVNGKERVKATNRKSRNIPAKWLAFFGATNQVEEVNEAFVHDNFPRGLVDQIKSVAKGAGGFVKIPPGDDRQHDNIHPALILPDAPLIHYKQQEGQKTCLTDSFASALHYMGIKQVASELFQRRKKIINRSNTWECFQQYLETRSKALKCIILSMSDWKLTDLKVTDLVAASLRGSDGKVDHAVTFHGNWIFDSNFERALPLNQASLDLCCSSDACPAKFVAVEEARLYSDYHSLVVGKKRAKAQNKMK